VGKETGAAVGLDVEVAILGRMNRSRQRIKPHERWKGLKKSLARQKKKGLWVSGRGSTNGSAALCGETVGLCIRIYSSVSPVMGRPTAVVGV
jgi:hypothetical protein